MVKYSTQTFLGSIIVIGAALAGWDLNATIYPNDEQPLESQMEDNDYGPAYRTGGYICTSHHFKLTNGDETHYYHYGTCNL